MKKILSYISALAAGVMLTASCDSFLEQDSPSTFSSSYVYSSYELTEAAVRGIAQAIAETDSYRGRFLPWYGFNTDIEWYNTYNPGDGKYDIAAYDCQASNSQMNTSKDGATDNPFAMMYSGIERANLIIEGLRQYGGVSDPAKTDMRYLLGEALTMRAMLYYDLIKAWGDVPFRIAPVDATTIYIPKTSRDVIYEQILADLVEAIDYLPYPGLSTQTSRTDRINKMFAQGLYARIALAASGKALRAENDSLVGTGTMGVYAYTKNANLSKDVLYPKALAYLKDAIESHTARLEPDYTQMWKNLNNMQNLTAGPLYETLYVIPFSNGRGRWNFTFAISSEGASISGGVSKGGNAGPVPTFFFKFADNDVRRDVTCVNYKWNKDESITPAGIGKWYFGKYRFEWMEDHPYTGGDDDGVKPVVMRFADILLMAAEIANDRGDLAKAKEYLKPILKRAYGGEDAADEYLAKLGDKDAFFNAIVDERAFEFCGEFLRKGDLIRWGMLKSKMDASVGDMKDLRDLAGDYAYLKPNKGTIWYRTGEDGISIDIYGLKKDQISAPEGEWEKVEEYVNADYAKKPKEGLGDDRVSGIYVNNPEQNMYWPIFSRNIIDNSKLVNDWGY